MAEALAKSHKLIENIINTRCQNLDCTRKLNGNLKIIDDINNYIKKYYSEKNGRPVSLFFRALYSPRFNICRLLSFNSGIYQGMICNNHALAAWQKSKGSISHNCYEIYQPGTSTTNCKASADRIRLEYEWTDQLSSPNFEDKCNYLGKCPLHDFLKN